MDKYECDEILKVYAVKKTEKMFDLTATLCDFDGQLHPVTIESLELYEKWFTTHISMKYSTEYGHEVKLEVPGVFKTDRIEPEFSFVNSYHKLGVNDKSPGQLRNYFMLSSTTKFYQNCTMLMNNNENRKCANLCPSYQGFSRSRYVYSDWTPCRVKFGQTYGYQYQYKNKCMDDCKDWRPFKIFFINTILSTFVLNRDAMCFIH